MERTTISTMTLITPLSPLDMSMTILWTTGEGNKT